MTDTNITQPLSGEQPTAAYGACPPEKATEGPDAMDADTYEEILGQLPKLRGPGFPEKEPEFELHPGKAHVARLAARFWDLLKCVGDEGADEGSYTDAELKLRLDLALNKVYWYASFWEDLWCWTRNSNPVFALCYSHPLHPVSRTERVFITVIHAVFVMMISSMTSSAKECVAAGLNTCEAAAVPTFEDDASFCCTAHHIFLSGAIEHVPAHLGGTLYALVVNTIFAQFMYQLGASCACVQDRKPGVRRFWEFLGHTAMFAVLILMIVPTVHWLNYDWRHGMLGSTVLHFVINKPLSMLGTTAIQTAVFTLMWRKQREQDILKEGYQHFFVTASDYQAFASIKAKAAAC